METKVGVRTSLPVLSDLFSDSCIAAMVRYTFEPRGITTRPLLSFTSEDTMPVSFCPALCVRELRPPSNLAEIAVPEDSVMLVAFAAGFAAVGDPVLVDDFAAGLEPLSFRGALASTPGRCRSRSESSMREDFPLSP